MHRICSASKEIATIVGGGLSSMRNMTNVLYALLLVFIISGCSFSGKGLLATDSRLVQQTEYEQGLIDHINSLEKGPTTQGSSCMTVFPFWSPW